ncbi:MAG: hypothetical protein NC102_05280 [Clostridium sp.]|nr:hypothetical protein [Clostridium sp.]
MAEYPDMKVLSLPEQPLKIHPYMKTSMDIAISNRFVRLFSDLAINSLIIGDTRYKIIYAAMNQPGNMLVIKYLPPPINDKSDPLMK